MFVSSFFLVCQHYITFQIIVRRLSVFNIKLALPTEFQFQSIIKLLLPSIQNVVFHNHQFKTIFVKRKKMRKSISDVPSSISCYIWDFGSNSTELLGAYSDAYLDEDHAQKFYTIGP